MTISIDQIIREVRRELNMRKSVYPKWVQAGKLKQIDADHRIAVMQKILDDYEAKSAQDKPDQPSLF